MFELDVLSLRVAFSSSRVIVSSQTIFPPFPPISLNSLQERKAFFSVGCSVLSFVLRGDSGWVGSHFPEDALRTKPPRQHKSSNCLESAQTSSKTRKNGLSCPAMVEC